jgi:hypothetical protein
MSGTRGCVLGGAALGALICNPIDGLSSACAFGHRRFQGAWIDLLNELFRSPLLRKDTLHNSPEVP